MIVLEKMIEKAAIVIAVNVVVAVNVAVAVAVNMAVAVAVLLKESANFYIQSKPVAKIGVECKTLHTRLSSSHHLMRH